MIRSTLRNHQEAKSFLNILWILSVTGASALILGHQDDQPYPTDLRALSMTPIKGIQYNSLKSLEEDFISLASYFNGSMDKNDVPPPYFQDQELEERKSDYFNGLQNLAQAILSDTTHEFPNDLYKTFGVRSKRKHAKKIQVFHLLGIFSRSINQAKRRRQQQRKQEEANISVRQFSRNNAHHPSDALQALAYVDGTLGLVQEDPTGGNRRSEDNKRTIFVSQGWAPTGGIEKDLQNQKSKAKGNSIANTNMYAFTSNHWGPLGKRGQPILKMGNMKPQIFHLFPPKF